MQGLGQLGDGVPGDLVYDHESAAFKPGHDVGRAQPDQVGKAQHSAAGEELQEAVTAAKDGAETFQRTRQEYATPAPAATPAPDFDIDVTSRLERLSQLHRDGHLDDVEYAEAKAMVISGQ